MSTLNGNDQVMPQRLMGALMLLAGLGFGYFSVWQPLQDAAHHVASLSVSMKSVAITPVLLLAGATFSFFPKFALMHLGGFQSRTPKTVAGWAYTITMIVLGFVFWFWVRAQFVSHGYLLSSIQIV